MEFSLLGRPGSGATLRLDYRAFAYAGKFVVVAPGKAVLRTPDGSPAVPEWEPTESLPPTVAASELDDDVYAAVSFSPDRTDPECCRLRYVTVHTARRGEGLGPRLVDRTVSRLAADGYARVRIAVNNPFAYVALYKSGFAYTGDRTGIAELELARPADEPTASPERVAAYRTGLRVFLDEARAGDRDLDPAERRFIAARLDDGSPPDG
ncbi:GCN5-related N-acetyltransferase [Halorubrum aidingense JCM 13560]|uniref:GCN5-related N-acetyltransferase n=1 Tax=Halorubrum aidingense JCM 13560 TaxID=1230454 RepID=M0PBJ9_9EURY|nr:GNAT family N-acetyltransferase [Halorubrum aidingense]EMA66914.1 GCN5-related N-acetyltransferase [Halorubrum aidingense JCM 13560]